MVGSPLVQALAKLLLLPTLITAIAFLIKGYGGPGDGFSAALIAASGVLLQYVAFGYRCVERAMALRYAPAAALGGMAAALIIAFVPVLRGEPILTHFPPAGGPVVRLGTVELNTAFAFDAAVFFLVFGFIVAAISAIVSTSRRTER